MNFNNIRISVRLLISFLLVILATTVLGTVSMAELNIVNNQSTIIAENWLPSVASVESMNTLTADLRIAELMHVSSLTDQDMKVWEKEILDREAAVEEGMETYEGLISSDEERRIWPLFKDSYEKYLSTKDEMIELS